METPPIINLSSVSYAYPNADTAALKDLSLRIEKPEFIGIVGPSGAGKSTLCRLLNGIVPQFFEGRFWGEASVFGMELHSTPISEISEKVGSVFQDPETQLIASTVELEVAFLLENLCFPREEIRKRIEWALNSVGLSGKESSHPAELSGGQQQRLALAAVLAVRPKLLVLDEPTSQLDPGSRAEIFGLLKKLHDEEEVTVIVASHALEELAETASHVILLKDGRIFSKGRPEAVFTDFDLLEEAKLSPPEVTEASSYVIGKEATSINGIVTLDAAALHLDKIVSALHRPENLMPKEDRPPTEKLGRSPLLDFDFVGYTFPNGERALENLSLRIESGEFVLILGKNGAGKSTLLKTALALLDPTEGEVRFDGRSAKDIGTSELAKRIAYVPQNPDYQIFNKSVGREISFALENLEIESSEIEERTRVALERMELTTLADRHPFSLSKGERTKVVIAAVLATDPDVIFLDEPTIGQDHHSACAILEQMATLNQLGVTIIVVTHHLKLIPNYAQRAVVIERGSVALDGRLEEVFAMLGKDSLEGLEPTQSVQLSRLIESRIDRPINAIRPEDFACPKYSQNN
ncbi:MAG: energy-coupling factor transporter ATPase [Verrucomicrobiota bacterium]